MTGAAGVGEEVEPAGVPPGGDGRGGEAVEEEDRGSGGTASETRGRGRAGGQPHGADPVVGDRRHHRAVGRAGRPARQPVPHPGCRAARSTSPPRRRSAPTSGNGCWRRSARSCGSSPTTTAARPATGPPPTNGSRPAWSTGLRVDPPRRPTKPSRGSVSSGWRRSAASPTASPTGGWSGSGLSLRLVGVRRVRDHGRGVERSPGDASDVPEAVAAAVLAASGRRGPHRPRGGRGPGRRRIQRRRVGPRRGAPARSDHPRPALDGGPLHRRRRLARRPGAPRRPVRRRPLGGGPDAGPRGHRRAHLASADGLRWTPLVRTHTGPHVPPARGVDPGRGRVVGPAGHAPPSAGGAGPCLWTDAPRQEAAPTPAAASPQVAAPARSPAALAPVGPGGLAGVGHSPPPSPSPSTGGPGSRRWRSTTWSPRSAGTWARPPPRSPPSSPPAPRRSVDGSAVTAGDDVALPMLVALTAAWRRPSPPRAGGPLAQRAGGPRAPARPSDVPIIG